MIRSSVESSFSINLKSMQFLGLYPTETYKNLHQAYSYATFFLLLVPLAVLGFLFLCTAKNIDMQELSYNGWMVIACNCFIVKYFPFIKNGTKVKNCVRYLDSVSLLEMNNVQRKMIEECSQICQRNGAGFIYGVLGCIIICCLRPFFSESQRLPIEIWLPFNVVENTLVYVTVYIYTSMGIVYAALGSGGIDPLIGGLACYASGHLKVLSDHLQNLGNYAVEKGVKENKTVETDRIIYENIKQCIRYHKLINNFCKEYEECFSLSVFCQFLASSVVFGFCCLYLSNVINTASVDNRLHQHGFILSKFPFLSVSFLTMTLYFVAQVIQIYFYCYYGSTLIEESSLLNTAVYMGNWFEYNLNSQKALIIFMENAKDPIVVTAGKILELSLDTFTMILKRSYSVLALLKNY